MRQARTLGPGPILDGRSAEVRLPRCVARCRFSQGEGCMRRLGSLKVRTRLFVLVLVACLPALGFTLYSFAEQRSEETAHVRASAAQIAQIGAGNQEASIAGLHSLLDGLSNVLQLQQLSPAICSYTLSSVHNLYASYFDLAVTDGT